MNVLSPGGRSFLECVLGSSDLGVDPGKGIPDNYMGKTAMIKDCATTTISFAPMKDTYIVMFPVPGYAYFKDERDIGTAPRSFIGVPYNTYDANFGSSAPWGTTQRVGLMSKFRYASMSGGLYPTCNYMSFNGSIQVWRADVSMGTGIRNVVGSVNFDDSTVKLVHSMNRCVTGLSSINSLAPRDNYSDSFIKGAYTIAFDISNGFTWSEFCNASEYTTYVDDDESGPNNKVISYDTTDQTINRYLTGLGNLNTLVFKVTNSSDTAVSAIFKSWCCIEIVPNADSPLYQSSGVSPPYDPLAMRMYDTIKTKLPVAVPCEKNANYFQNAVALLKNIFSVGANYLPGPFGLVSRGAEYITDAIQAWTL